jgi:hypothetical protein
VKRAVALFVGLVIVATLAHGYWHAIDVAFDGRRGAGNPSDR